MQLQEAYLRAGNLFAEADQKNADAIRFVTENTGTGNLSA